MNKIFYFLFPVLFILFSGCSADDEPVEETVAYEKVAILSTNLPEELIVGQEMTLRLTYDRPTRCHRFSGIEYEELKGEYYFGIVTAYDKDRDCENVDLTAATSFEFIPEAVDFYIFKFWQGRNEQGEDIYLTVKVPVTLNGV